MDEQAQNYKPGATVDDGTCTYNVTFNVDMSCSGENPTTVHISGPFCGWCDQGYNLSDPDADGVWSGTFALPLGSLEFKYMIDKFADQEDLIGDSCGVITDGATFANRELMVDGSISTNDTYGQCTACN